MEKAIQRAIEGGWMLKGNLGGIISHYEVETNCFVTKDGNTWQRPPNEVFLMDKDFWQALSESEGWVEVCDNPDHGFINMMVGVKSSDIGRLGCPACGHNKDHVVESTRFRWKKEWHRFIDHLAEGKDADSFFNKLLK